MDGLTFQQLKETKYYNPEVTEVIFDSNLMLTITTDSANLVQDGYDMLWDTTMCKFISNHYRDGTKFIEQKSKEKSVRSRLLIEVTKHNIDFLNR